MILASIVLDKFHPKPSEVAFLTVFCDNFQLEVVSDVISGVAIELAGMDILVRLSFVVKRFLRYSRGSLCLVGMNEHVRGLWHET